MMLFVSLCLGLCTATATASSLRLVSFNIHAWRDAQHHDNFDGLVELLQHLQPDVLCLNEVLHPFVAPPADDAYWETVRQRRGYGKELPSAAVPQHIGDSYLSRLSSALEMPHCEFAAATQTRSFFGRAPFGNCILSKHKLEGARRVLCVATEADLQLGDQERTIVDLEDRSCLLASVVLPGGQTLGLACTHLDHRAEEMREKQICQFLRETQDAFGQQPYVLCGDLNSFDERDMDVEAWRAICALYASKGWPAPRSRSLVRTALEDAGLSDTFELQADPEPGVPHPPPSSWTATRIDYVMLSNRGRGDAKDVMVRSHRTLQSDVSDHLPLVVDIEVS